MLLKEKRCEPPAFQSRKPLLQPSSAAILLAVSILTFPPRPIVAQSTTPPDFPLIVRVFSGDTERIESYENRIETFLWKKIEADAVNDNSAPVVLADDGTVWRQIQNGSRYGSPTPYRHGTFDAKLPQGTYRVSVVDYKVYDQWEGPPGSREGSKSGQQDEHDKIWYYDVTGVGGPQHVFDWVLSDPIVIDGKREKYELNLSFGGVPASFVVTAPPEEAEKLALRLFREDGFYLENASSPGNSGLPSQMTFDRLPPGKYRLCAYRGQLRGNVLTPNVDIFSVEVVEEGPNVFSFAADQSLIEQAPWRVYGAVRDADGNPISKISVRATSSFREIQSLLTAVTDENGNYTLPITPLDLSSGTVREDGKPPVLGFCFQHLILLADNRHYYDREAKKTYSIKEKSRSQEGDLIVVGDFAGSEEIAKLKEKFAAERYDIILVEKNSPCRVDFVVKLKPESPDDPPSSFVFYPNFWLRDDRDRRRDEVYRKIVFPYSMNRSYKESLLRADHVTASLRFPKREIMVGEPMSFDYVVRNDSDADLWITVGGDYRGSGRPTSFTMRAVRVDGDSEEVVYEIPVTFNMGGIIGNEKIPVGGEYAFDLCLPCWLELKEPGEYRIDVARYLNPSPKPMFSAGGIRDVPAVPRTASGTLTVKPFDHDAFGKLIDEWGERTAVKMLVHIEDERVIPWLIKASQERDDAYCRSSLAKFNDDRALEEIKRGIDSPKDNKSQEAAANLAGSKHPDAIKILLEHEDHPNEFVRLRVVQAADKMPPEVAFPMLERHFNDPGWEGKVGEEARRIDKELREKHDPQEQRPRMRRAE